MLSRETAGLSDGWQVMGTPAAGPAQDLPADNLKSSEADIAASSAPLGGMGDEAAPIAPIPPLGGLGDEEEPVPLVPEFGITTEAGETSQQVPGTYLASSRHRALPPVRHDLDPYVPIGMRLGSFLLFTEAEIGTILTDNVSGDGHRYAFRCGYSRSLRTSGSKSNLEAAISSRAQRHRRSDIRSSADFSVEDDLTSSFGDFYNRPASSM